MITIDYLPVHNKVLSHLRDDLTQHNPWENTPHGPGHGGDHVIHHLQC